jgi:predicted dehydrogenase
MTYGRCGGFPDPVRTENIESRLQGLVWVNDIALGCDYIGNYDIHAIDAALWAIGERPISAMGHSRICRPEPHGDAHDVCSVIYKYENGVVHNHFGEALANNSHSKSLTCDVFGQKASAQIDYFRKSFIRGGVGHCSGKVEALYSGGAKRNIAKFHKNITESNFENDTLQRSVDGALTAILGKEAAHRGMLLTMDQVIKENKQCKPDLTGLKS